MNRLHVIGCGAVGSAIAALLSRVPEVSEVSFVSRTHASAVRAREFSKCGTAFESISELPEAEIWMVASPDAVISTLDREIATSSSLRPGDIVFHCSGALDSSALRCCSERGARVASVHPIRSFADWQVACDSFPGTPCSVEGDLTARETLSALFASIGARPFPIEPDKKLLCHAGHVFASNYLVVIQDIARRLYRSSGVPEEISGQIIQSLARGTLDNLRYVGTTRALTGPIVRGEVEVVRQQCQRLCEEFGGSEDEIVAMLYASLGDAALEIAARGKRLGADVIQQLSRVLSGHVK